MLPRAFPSYTRITWYKLCVQSLLLPGNGEPAEITALRANLIHISDVVTSGGNLVWFANCLITKEFITQREAREIQNMHGVFPANQANLLIDSVFTKLNMTEDKRRWFLRFAEIFSAPAHSELFHQLKRSLTDTQVWLIMKTNFT